DARFADEPLRDEVARMSLAPGDLVRAAAVEQPLVIERQQLVRLTVRRGAVTVEASGIAMESGRRGDVIRVRPTTSDNVLSAVVRSNGWVEVP
ncbi:MAG: flagella basal body P-ring formation protein FlgA, partial [Bradymonadia bacterium]